MSKKFQSYYITPPFHFSQSSAFVRNVNLLQRISNCYSFI